MKFTQDELQGLRQAVSDIDRLDEEIRAKDGAIAQAEAAVSRLTWQLAALREEQAVIVRSRFVMDNRRIAALIAGESLDPPETAAIAERAEKARIADAHAEQIDLDLAGVRTHLAQQIADRDKLLKPARDKAEAIFLTTFADAGFRTYKAAALAFLAEHIPPLQAVASAVIQRDPNRSWPDWWSDLFHHLHIRWSGPKDNPGGLVSAWPRGDNATLVDGTPLPSTEGVPALIEAVRQGKAEF